MARPEGTMRRTMRGEVMACPRFASGGHQHEWVHCPQALGGELKPGKAIQPYSASPCAGWAFRLQILEQELVG